MHPSAAVHLHDHEMCDGIGRAAAGRIKDTHSMAKTKLGAPNVMQVFLGIVADTALLRQLVQSCARTLCSGPVTCCSSAAKGCGGAASLAEARRSRLPKCPAWGSWLPKAGARGGGLASSRDKSGRLPNCGGLESPWLPKAAAPAHATECTRLPKGACRVARCPSALLPGRFLLGPAPVTGRCHGRALQQSWLLEEAIVTKAQVCQSVRRRCNSRALGQNHRPQEACLQMHC